jgi:hypothetical protein
MAYFSFVSFRNLTKSYKQYIFLKYELNQLKNDRMNIFEESTRTLSRFTKIRMGFYYCLI